MDALIACRTHYTLAYLAWANRAGSFNYNGLAMTTTGFATPWDGGGNYEPEDNKIWHVFMEAVFSDPFSEKPDHIAVEVMCRENVRIFNLPPFDGVGRVGWPEMDFEELGRLIYDNWSDYPAIDSEIPANQVLTAMQIKFCERVEKWYFSLWGQGGHKPF